jgi:hypothetical protein
VSLTASAATSCRPRTGRVGAAALSVLLTVAATLLIAWPAAAEHECIVVEVPLPGGGYRLVRECRPHEGGGSGGGGSGVTCERFVVLEGYGHVFDEQGRRIRPVRYVCSDGTEWQRWECIPGLNPDPPGPPCDSGADEDLRAVFEGLLQQATARVDVPLPGLRHTFDQPADDGTIRAIVRAETWWWSESALEPIEVHDQDGPVWVRVTATPGGLWIDPGDGSGSFTCASQLAYNRNRSYYDQVPGEPRGACVHVYEHPHEAVTATMSVSWTVTYQGFAPGMGGRSGSLGTQTGEEAVTFPVKEIQSVIVR